MPGEREDWIFYPPPWPQPRRRGPFPSAVTPDTYPGRRRTPPYEAFLEADPWAWPYHARRGPFDPGVAAPVPYIPRHHVQPWPDDDWWPQPRRIGAPVPVAAVADTFVPHRRVQPWMDDDPWPQQPRRQGAPAPVSAAPDTFVPRLHSTPWIDPVDWWAQPRRPGSSPDDTFIPRLHVAPLPIEDAWPAQPRRPGAFDQAAPDTYVARRKPLQFPDPNDFSLVFGGAAGDNTPQAPPPDTFVPRLRAIPWDAFADDTWGYLYQRRRGALEGPPPAFIPKHRLPQINFPDPGDFFLVFGGGGNTDEPLPLFIDSGPPIIGVPRLRAEPVQQAEFRPVGASNRSEPLQIAEFRPTGSMNRAAPVQISEFRPVNPTRAQAPQQAEAKPVNPSRAEPIQQAEAKPVNPTRAEPIQQSEFKP